MIQNTCFVNKEYFNKECVYSFFTTPGLNMAGRKLSKNL